MDTPAIEYLRDEILKRLDEHETISIYLEDAGVEWFSLNSIVTTTLFPHKHRKRIRKVAMVTNRSWIHVIAGLNNFLIDAQVRNFKSKDRTKAMEWVTQD